jgi:hypothetical protein
MSALERPNWLDAERAVEHANEEGDPTAKSANSATA